MKGGAFAEPVSPACGQRACIDAEIASSEIRWRSGQFVPNQAVSPGLAANRTGRWAFCTGSAPEWRARPRDKDRCQHFWSPHFLSEFCSDAPDISALVARGARFFNMMLHSTHDPRGLVGTLWGPLHARRRVFDDAQNDVDRCQPCGRDPCGGAGW